MHILLTNDDGIFAPGLSAIYKKLADIGDVTVVAPANSQSGSSHSITFNQPVVGNEVDINGLFTGFSIQGSPTDCVKIAAMQLCDKPIDLVVAGINSGANAGINIYYSGTVAAAMEAAFLKIPAVAMSLAYEFEETMDFETAAGYCAKILKKLMPVKSGCVINVNIPQLSAGPPKGVRVVPQSIEGFHEHYTREKNEHGQTIFQLVGGLHRDDSEKNGPTDSASLAEGYITISALAPGMTDYEKTRRLEQKHWETGIV